MTVSPEKPSYPQRRLNLKKIRTRFWDKDWNLLSEYHGKVPPSAWVEDINVTADHPSGVRVVGRFSGGKVYSYEHFLTSSKWPDLWSL